ncbi:MAG: bifunctional riboflavin kinase/FAD synthetase [Bryobacterales bacterium]|nr:bifunctional riboflavin kinase/FAD synthetase [Bryobacterales bacterium]MEB2362367.1 bifunctional riboflavin kinase/FAD synthetase [Bryobacterales bacterium]
MSGTRIYHDLKDVPGDLKPTALTIGNFDGVHLGHRRIFKRLVEIAREHGWQASVLTFDPHPAKVVAPTRSPRLLMTPEQRAKVMFELGISRVAIAHFDTSFSKLTPEQFVRQVVVGKLKAKAVLVGDNFRFGNRQAGDTELLVRLGHELGYAVEVIPSVSVRGMVVSSTGIRRLIEAGRVTLACRALGRFYALEGDVVPGKGIGSRHTVPTLNLRTAAEVLPAVGVYVTRTHAVKDGRSWPSITNVGYRPTFNGDNLSIETFLLTEFDGNAPPQICVEFLCRLRGERRFDTPAELKTQIMRDAGRARSYFRRIEQLAAIQTQKSGLLI